MFNRRDHFNPTANIAYANVKVSGHNPHKLVVREKPICPSYRRRKLRREGAIADIQLLNSEIAKSREQLKREDSFILVDCGNHFKMVKPAYAKRYYHSVPENIITVAPYHAFGPDVGQELLELLHAVPVATPPVRRKRVRFQEEEGDMENSQLRKRLRSD